MHSMQIVKQLMQSLFKCEKSFLIPGDKDTCGQLSPIVFCQNKSNYCATRCDVQVAFIIPGRPLSSFSHKVRLIDTICQLHLCGSSYYPITTGLGTCLHLCGSLAKYSSCWFYGVFQNLWEQYSYTNNSQESVTDLFMSHLRYELINTLDFRGCYGSSCTEGVCKVSACVYGPVAC